MKKAKVLLVQERQYKCKRDFTSQYDKSYKEDQLIPESEYNQQTIDDQDNFDPDFDIVEATSFPDSGKKVKV